MKKKFFTKASPKAAEGIRRAYANTGAQVAAVVDPRTGTVTVVVSLPDDRRKWNMGKGLGKGDGLTVVGRYASDGLTLRRCGWTHSDNEVAVGA